jgi:hypothetical protein
MPTQELKDFVEERLRAYDPNIDLTPGSPAETQVVDPIVNRFQPDPFEMSIEKFLYARLTQEFPDVNFREGSGVYDLLLKAGSVLMDPISREVQIIKQNQSFARPELLAGTEADSLAANIFVYRDNGGLATGVVRLYFNAPVALNVSVGNVCYTAGGLRFIPSYLQSITAESMLFNQSGSLYYFDITVTAEEAGSDYNIGKGEIVGITNLNASVLVKNLEKFSGGLDDETTDALVSKARESITERSLVTSRGVSARLRSEFGDLTQLQVVGMFDEEMGRDVITGGDLGVAVLTGTDGYTEDDGDGDRYSYVLKSRGIDFTDYFGAIGLVSQPHYVMVSSVVYGNRGQVSGSSVHQIVVADDDLRYPDFVSSDMGGVFAVISSDYPTNCGPAIIEQVIAYNELRLNRSYLEGGALSWMLLRPPAKYRVLEVLSTHELLLETPLLVNRQELVWSLHVKELTLSDMPGGILFGDDQGTLSIQSDQIHVGGASDFYVRGTGIESKQLVITAISDEAPIDKGLDLIADTAKPYFVQSPSKDFTGLAVKQGMSLVVESGANARTRTILRVGVLPPDTTGPAVGWLQVDSPITSTDPAMRYKIVDAIDIDLREPKTVRGEGDDLQTLQLASLVTTTGAVDFVALGAAAGDTLNITEGLDKGTYSVSSTSGTGNRNLIISALMKATANNLAWSLYQAKEGISFPLVRINSIDILDSSQQPTGFTVPYAPPVDSRSSSFSNTGRGTRVEGSDIVTGIVASTDLNTLIGETGLPITVLSGWINGITPFTVELTGFTNKDAVVQAINAVVPDIASLLNLDGKDYLTLRSSDRYISLSANSQNANVGFNVDGEDNRTIRSMGDISDWTVYGLEAGKDVVYIKTGDNIGYLHLVWVSETSIGAVAFDESKKTVRFLAPNMNVHMAAGSRSYGKARVYFLEPTSFTVRGAWHPQLLSVMNWPANGYVDTVLPRYTGFGFDMGGEGPMVIPIIIAEDEDPVTYFTATVNGSTMRYIPDPDLKHQVLPTLDEDVPNNLKTDDSNIAESTDVISGAVGQGSRMSPVDFLRREIRTGDRLDVTYQPIQGDNDISELTYQPSPTLAGKTFLINVGENPTKTVTFSDQLTGPDDVAREINAAVGEDVAYIETITDSKFLRLEADKKIVYHSSSTSGEYFWATAPTVNLNNYAAARSDVEYQVMWVGKLSDATQSTFLTLDKALAEGECQHFSVSRPGVQRIHATDMAQNIENGLYYMDIELVSEGIGDEWNLGPDALFVVTGYQSDGYHLEVVNPNLSYSTEEDVKLVISHRILTVGSSDRPDEATALSDQNIQVNYERSPLTASIQSFARSELERVLCASLLVRHLQPHYLNFTLNYRGGSSADIVEADVKGYIADLTPSDRCESSDLQNLALRRGATYVQNPINLVAVIHDEERKVSVDRSQDYVTHGRLATFFLGTVTVSRETEAAL